MHCHDPQSFSSSLGQCFPVPTMIRTFLCGSNQSHERFHSEQAVSDFDVVEPCRSKPKSDTVHGDNNSFLTFDSYPKSKLDLKFKLFTTSDTAGNSLQWCFGQKTRSLA